MAFTEENKKSFDFASDIIKQVITLNAAIITITVSAARFIFADADPRVLNLMFYSWIFLILSITFGIMGYMQLTGELARPSGDDGRPDVYKRAVVFFVSFHLLFFLIGVFLVSGFAYAGQVCQPEDANWACRWLLWVS